MYDGWNKYIPHRLMCLDDWPIGNDTIRMCALVGVGVDLLEKVCHYGGRI